MLLNGGNTCNWLGRHLTYDEGGALLLFGCSELHHGIEYLYFVSRIYCDGLVLGSSEAPKIGLAMRRLRNKVEWV